MQPGIKKIVSPKVFRMTLRNGEAERGPTTFKCKGYKQASLTVLPKRFADDFDTFAKANRGAIPLLYKSKVGEVAAPPLCEDSDVRTDIPLYSKWVDGKITQTLENLKDYDFSDYVSFYIGCSFSFNDILLSNELIKEVDASKNVSMYETNIDCHSSGIFKSKLVVSMRAIHESKLSLVATLSNPLSDVHGAPIHYGNPKFIGINDLDDFMGDETRFDDGCIPVFWACGVVAINAIKGAKIDLAFTHSLGRMLITDVEQDALEIDENDHKSICEVIKFNDKSEQFSTLSKATLKVLENILTTVKQDPMQRGCESLVVPEDFTKSALALSHASTVALITGFPCCDTDPHDEANGLPGSISLIAALQSLGKRVVLLVDDHTLAMNKSILAKLVTEGCLTETIEVVPYADGLTKLKDSDGKPLYDVVLSSERVGRSKDGRYYTMKGKDISSLVTPIDNFFKEATNCEDVTTISIGDGGNKLGMGKVYDKVCQHIHLGEKIACNVSADLLISAVSAVEPISGMYSGLSWVQLFNIILRSVSNWACYGLCLALYALRSCSIHERYFRKATGFSVNASERMGKSLPTVAREKKILEIVESFGIKDGVNPD